MMETIQRTIPFSEPTVGEAEYLAVQRAIEMKSLGGDGKFCRETEMLMSKMFNVKHALLTTSCTHALELAMMTLDLKPGDEVILPSFTFTSTANVIIRQGAVPVFVDIDSDTFNMDASKIEAAITPNTRIIMPVHYAGQGCDMDAIMDIAKRHNLYVVEDAAQGVGASWNGQPLGTIGDIGCLSFHATKNISCGEGGAFLTNNTKLAHKAEIIREKGTNRAAFLRGEVDKYTWVSLGSSFVLTDMLAALLKVQLERTSELNENRIDIWNTYYSGTAELEAKGLVKRPVFHSNATNNGHIFALLINNGRRDEIMAAMKKRGISCTFHYVPLHSSPFMVDYFNGNVENLPITDKVSNSLLRLPIFAHLSTQDVEYILSQLHEVFS
ncbi:dTDP-4-amino-4,6-dideoxygalactose transaminase [Candidatus Chlorohelix sp.]|uniref:dTDP-4-amino-4,6-dideoxygalactose transaminase n=1 Tax=Candidatus Chlorohelix sp. TaxID=3139201 RepID=UPI003037655A